MSESKVQLIKPRCRPSVEDEKRRYWELRTAERRIAKRHAKLPAVSSRKTIPSNSEPWLPHPPRNFAEIFYISDQIEAEIRKWREI